MGSEMCIRDRDAFLVNTEQGIIKFVREGRLYTYEPSKKYLAAVKATNEKKNKRYDQFLTTKHNALTESLTALDTTVNEREQRKIENDTSAQKNTDDGEQLGDETSAQTNSTRHSGADTQNLPNSVHNNLSDENTETVSYDFLMTKEGNRDGYTERQYQDAKRAWKLYLNTGGGGIENFKHYLRQNIIQNSPVTNNDINRAQKIFVHDVGNLKGRTVRKTPERVREHKIKIPRSIVHQKDDFTLFIDLFFVNKLPMLTSIDSPVRNRGLVCLDNREIETIYKGIDTMLRLYNKAGFTIARIRCDNEFSALSDDVMDDNICLLYTSDAADE